MELKKRKFNHIVLIVFILFISHSSIYAVKIKRICVKGDDVILMYYNITDSCDKFGSLIICTRESPFDVFKPIDTIFNSQQTDFIHIGAIKKGTKWSYFIKLLRNCSGNDSIFSDTMSIDLIKPNILEIDSVSVNNGKTEIGWKPSTSKDIKGYIIYYEDFTGNIGIIDTVYGKNNTFYTDQGGRNPGKRIEKYEIAAFDSCDNITVISKVHNTIFHLLKQDTCREEITLEWNKYLRWADTRTSYSIYYSKDGINFSLVTTKTDNIPNYIMTGLENKVKYSFFIRATNLDSNFTSSSNITEITTNFIIKPSYLYLKNVTTINDKLEITWAIDKICQIKDFKICRKEKDLTFSVYETVPYTSQTEFSFIDDSVDINNVQYSYIIQETDICNNAPMLSNMGENILLKNEKIDDYYQLKWNRYSDWKGGIKTQTLYNKEKEDLTWALLDKPDFTKESYTKNLNVSDLKGKEYCYYIENEEGDANMYGYKEVSKSNISCISGAPVVFIPSAIYPKGINYSFKPFGNNFDSTKTEIQIYSRWGQLVWNCSGLTSGWQGNDNKNKELPSGVYYYIVSIFGKDQSKKDFTGNITLIR